MAKSKIFLKFSDMNTKQTGVDYAADKLFDLFYDLTKNTEAYSLDAFKEKRKAIIAEAKEIETANYNKALNELIDWLENDYKNIVSNVDIIRKAKELRDKN